MTASHSQITVDEKHTKKPSLIYVETTSSDYEIKKRTVEEKNGPLLRDGSFLFELAETIDGTKENIFQKAKFLGKGFFGETSLFTSLDQKSSKAIKTFPDSKYDFDISCAHKEAELLQMVYGGTHVLTTPRLRISMPFLEGRTLQEKIKQNEYNTIAEYLELMINIISVYETLPLAGIVHCDAKTENILIDSQNHIWICDFGQGSKLNEPYSAQADIKSLGKDLGRINLSYEIERLAKRSSIKTDTQCSSEFAKICTNMENSTTTTLKEFKSQFIDLYTNYYSNRLLNLSINPAFENLHTRRFEAAKERLRKALEQHPVNNAGNSVLQTVISEEKFISEDKLYLVTEFLNLTADGGIDPKAFQSQRYHVLCQRLANIGSPAETKTVEPVRSWGKVLAGAGLVFISATLMSLSIIAAVASFGGSLPLTLACFSWGSSVAIKGLSILCAVIGGIGILGGGKTISRSRSQPEALEPKGGKVSQAGFKFWDVTHNLKRDILDSEENTKLPYKKRL
jgi:predicted Ser/Thr protein kinase